MPIYAYRCTSCGHAKDVLQKLSDPALTVCPACGASSFAKQLTAAGFQLKGSGWYATDFKSGTTAKKPDDTGAGKDATPTDKPGETAKPSTAGETAKTSTAGETGKSTPTEPKSSAAGCGSGCACH